MAVAVAAVVGSAERDGRREPRHKWETKRAEGKRERERKREGSFGLRGYQCVSSLQNECPRFLPRGLYHVATIHAPPAAWLLAEGTGGVWNGIGAGGGSHLSRGP